MSIFCFLMIQRYIAAQKINYFEYSVLILFALLGIFFICSSNDLITAYLSIELQSLSFYVMAAMKKDSAFSVDACINYFFCRFLNCIGYKLIQFILDMPEAFRYLFCYMIAGLCIWAASYIMIIMLKNPWSLFNVASVKYEGRESK